MSIREAFEQAFGTENADAIMAAANEHKNGIHNNPGSDPFKWALAITIGSECLTRFRDSHGITADPDRVKEWVYWNGELGSHDGDIDYLALMVGTYDGWYNPDAATWSATEAGEQP